MDIQFDFPWGKQTPDLYILTGSRLYGYATESSDWDYRGAVLEPPEYLLGRRKFEQMIRDHEKDITVWSFTKFFHLLETESPNVWELLFAPKENILICSDKLRPILDYRNLFVSKKAIKPMLGFADGELKAAFAQLGNPKWKRAAHTVRLLGQAVQVLSFGEIDYPSPNASTLRKIRDGEIAQDDIYSMVETSKLIINKLLQTSDIPETKNAEKLDDLYYSICGESVTKLLRSYL